MPSRHLSGEALVLRTRPVGESDLLTLLLWEDGSRLPARARGARASRRRFAGCLQPFCRLRVSLTAGRSARWPTLEEATLIEDHRGLRTELKRMGQAAYALELAECFALEGEANPELWLICNRVLTLMNRRALEGQELAYLELRFLEAAGVSPSLDRCLQCGRQQSPSWCVDPTGQGFYCRECRPRGGRVISAAALQLLRRLQRKNLKGQDEAAVVGEARSALAVFLEEHTGQRFRSREFLRQIGER